jgi:hypothetical protein
MPTEEEIDHSKKLEETRKKSVSPAGAAQKARDLAVMATPLGALSLASQLQVFDMPWIGLALSFAILKDVIDLVLGFTIIIPIVFALFALPIIALCLFIMGASSQNKKSARKTTVLLNRFLRGGPAARWGLLFAGTIFEFLPALDYLPVETTVAIVTIGMVLNERRIAARDARRLEAAEAVA